MLLKLRLLPTDRQRAFSVRLSSSNHDRPPYLPTFSKTVPKRCTACQSLVPLLAVVDCLGITTTFEVEDTVVGQRAVSNIFVGSMRVLFSTRPKRRRSPSILLTVQGSFQDIVIENCERCLLFSPAYSVPAQNRRPSKSGDYCFAIAPVSFWIRKKIRSIYNSKVWLKFRSFFIAWNNQKMVQK